MTDRLWHKKNGGQANILFLTLSGLILGVSVVKLLEQSTGEGSAYGCGVGRDGQVDPDQAPALLQKKK